MITSVAFALHAANALHISSYSALHTPSSSALRASSSSVAAVPRRHALACGGGAVLATVFGAPFPAAAAAAAAEAPRDWGLVDGKDSVTYLPDTRKLLRHMEFCVAQPRGGELTAVMNKNMKREMAEYFADYAVAKAGKTPALSDVRTDISLLSTHYTQYGFETPPPAPILERLTGDFKKIRKALDASEARAAGAAAQGEAVAARGSAA